MSDFPLEIYVQQDVDDDRYIHAYIDVEDLGDDEQVEDTPVAIYTLSRVGRVQVQRKFIAAAAIKESK